MSGIQGLMKYRFQGRSENSESRPDPALSNQTPQTMNGSNSNDSPDEASHNGGSSCPSETDPMTKKDDVPLSQVTTISEDSTTTISQDCRTSAIMSESTAPVAIADASNSGATANSEPTSTPKRSIESLLKYRFQRKSETRLVPTYSSSPQPGQPGRPPTSDTRHWTDVVQSQSSQITAKSSQASTQSSVIGAVTNQPITKVAPGVISKRGAIVVLSDSDGDSPKKSTKSSWLTPMVKSLGSTCSSPSTSASSAQTQNSEDLEERELATKLDTLRQMFPEYNQGQLVDALVEAASDVDKAINIIIDNHRGTTDEGAKRKFSRIQAVQSDSDDEPASKKACTEAPASKFVQSADESKVTFLSEAFPRISVSVIRLTLKSKQNDIDRAIQALTSSGLNKQHGVAGSPPGGAQQSIKSIQAARSAAGKRPPSPSMPNLTQEETAVQPRFTKKVGGPVKRNEATANSTKSKPIVEVILDSSEDEKDQEFSGAESDSETEDAPSDPILEFFNSGTSDELSTVNGLSKKKAQSVIELRPFKDWEDLVAKIEHSKDLSYNMITGCKEVLRMRQSIEKLMQKCSKIRERLQWMVDMIKDKDFLRSRTAGMEYITEQPANLNKQMTLASYQMVGLNWLNIMHHQNLNGILGDEMGLGKTIQTIAFFGHLMANGMAGPHVIVAPSSTIDNWLREMTVWCPDIKVMLYYGSQDERRDLREQILEDEATKFNVLLTSYNMATGNMDDRTLFRRCRFHYAVFDEGHMLKNMSSIRYQTLMKVNAERRLLLTGTPLQNNLVELMSLLAFVMPDMFSGKTDSVKKVFTSITTKNSFDNKSSYERRAIDNAKNILKPFFLRRLKREVLQELPKKVDIIDKVVMIPDQQELYDSLKAQFNRNMEQIEDPSKDSTKTTANSSMLMQLRKAANHPLLHRQLFNDKQLREMAKAILKEPTHRDANPDLVFEDMEVMSDFELHRLCLQYGHLNRYQLDSDDILASGKFRYLDILLPQLKEKGCRVLLFSQFTMMLDIIESYMEYNNYLFLRLDGQTPVVERQELIDQFNTNPEVFVFLLSTKAGGLGINLTAADTVVLHDIDFNPYNDKQAEDRCHRVGQTKTVTVYRLISKGSVEEAMLQCAQAKLNLEKDVTGQGHDGDDEENPNDVVSLLKQALTMRDDPGPKEHVKIEPVIHVIAPIDDSNTNEYDEVQVL